MPWPGPSALAELSAALTRASERDRAYAVVRRIPERRDRQTAALRLVEAHADADQPELAESLLLDDELWAWGRPNPPERLAAAWIRRGLPDRAEALADLVQGRDRFITLATAAAALTSAGQVDRARSVIRRIDDQWGRDRALASLAAALAVAGDLDAAEATSREITDRSAQRLALQALAVAAEKAGDTARADDYIAAATEPPAVHIGEQEKVLTEVLLATGDFARAERLAASITEPYARVKALVALAAQVPPTTARHLLARAFCDGLNEPALELLGTLQPEALPTIARLLLGED
ncbi:hypothetical protein [Actinoplanes philippinensis]|uniref:hypothetical protein n=1 Tax=Actinoplanes philippinensis TaxID=35752 RepID=UPI0033D324AF